MLDARYGVLCRAPVLHLSVNPLLFGPCVWGVHVNPDDPKIVRVDVYIRKGHVQHLVIARSGLVHNVVRRKVEAALAQLQSLSRGKEVAHSQPCTRLVPEGFHALLELADQELEAGHATHLPPDLGQAARSPPALLAGAPRTEACQLLLELLEVHRWPRREEPASEDLCTIYKLIGP